MPTMPPVILPWRNTPWSRSLRILLSSPSQTCLHSWNGVFCFLHIQCRKCILSKVYIVAPPPLFFLMFVSSHVLMSPLSLGFRVSSDYVIHQGEWVRLGVPSTLSTSPTYTVGLRFGLVLWVLALVLGPKCSDPVLNVPPLSPSYFFLSPYLTWRFVSIPFFHFFWGGEVILIIF